MANEKSKALTDKVSHFLFRQPSNGDKKRDNEFLDVSCNVLNRAEYGTLTYYRILEEQYGCEAAGKIANVLERLSISTVRSSEGWNARKEGVVILSSSQLPKKETLIRGIADNIKELAEEPE
jgi:hypothetical protein